ncbi:MAG: Nif3-like dinuclear metal center hexameric protein [Chlamydiales bacterium]|nr:Nif3-like dinuclear metal center hexameric protein [Chlamydiales bacterium]
MNLTVQILCNYLEDFLKGSQFQDYCPNGLQVEGTRTISKIGVAVSASLATIQEAVKLDVDALIVHHGIFWNGDSFVISGSKQKKLKILLENNIALLAYHLPLDAHPVVGNNWKAAIDLGMSDLSSFNIIGVQGKFANIAVDGFVATLESYYDHLAIVALAGKKDVSSAAIISGGAYKDVLLAARAGVDCFITGSFDEPAWNIAQEERINFIALGHTATEKVGPKALGDHLLKAFNVQVFFIDTPNPF